MDELRAVVTRPGGITDAEMKGAEKYERELRHDVMAHVHALGDSCPKAKGIIHLGMTSQDVVCNADMLILAEALLTRTGWKLPQLALPSRVPRAPRVKVPKAQQAEIEQPMPVASKEEVIEAQASPEESARSSRFQRAKDRK